MNGTCSAICDLSSNVHATRTTRRKGMSLLMVKTPSKPTWRPGRLARNAIAGSVAQSFRLGLQSIFFLLLARYLDVADFGMFSGIWVLCVMLANFSGLGFPVLTFRAASLHPQSAPRSAGTGMRVVVISSIPLVITLVCIVTTTFDHHPSILILLTVGISELLAVPLLWMLSSLHQGYERLGRSQAMLASLWAARLCALLIVVASGHAFLEPIMLAHALATVVAVVIWLVADRKMFRPPLHSPNASRDELLTGAAIALSGALAIASTEISQSVALAAAGAVVAGLVAAAYKLAILASAPLSVLCQAASARLIRAAHQGSASFTTLLRAMAGPMVGLALAGALALLAGAEAIPYVFGADYRPAIPIARALSILPALAAARLVASYVLVAMSWQRKRAAADLACLAIVLPVSSMVFHTYGLGGAVAAILIVEGATVATLCTLAWHAIRSSSTRLPEITQ